MFGDIRFRLLVFSAVHLLSATGVQGMFVFGCWYLMLFVYRLLLAFDVVSLSVLDANR